jgi:hypothetical protein
MNIKETALELYNQYAREYRIFCDENPGYIMHGADIMRECMRKASFAESIEDLHAMKRCFQIEYKAAEGMPNGFRFNVRAMDELINKLNISKYE